MHPPPPSHAAHSGLPASSARLEELDDAALLALVGSTEREALAELYRRHAGWLTIRLRRRCGDAELVDLALQDTFLAVWRRPGGFRGDGEVAAWLWGIAVRRLIDQLRRRRPEPVDPVTFAAPGSAVPSEPSAEHGALESSFEGGDLGQAFAYLAPELQAVLVATAIDGLTTREASKLLGIPHGTVKTRLQRARGQLRGHLGELQGGFS